MFYGANMKNYWTSEPDSWYTQEYCARKSGYVVVVPMLNLKAGKFGNLCG